MSRYLALFLMIGLLLVSCGTSRFTFDRTEKTITELGGTYNKEVGEELEKVYKNGDIDDVIEMVYQSDYTGGDPYVVVEGYLGEEPFEEFKKRVKEIKKEIENLWKGVDLEKDQIGGNEGLALAVLDETYPEGLVIEALGGLDNKNTQDFKNLLDQKYALRDELRGILSQSGIEGIKEAIVNEEYTEEEIEAYLGKSTLDDAKLALAKETGTDGFVPVAKKSSETGEMEFVAKKDSAKTNPAEDEEMPIIQRIVVIIIVLAFFYIIAAVVRTSYRGALPIGPSLAAVIVLTFLAIGGATLALGWSIYWLTFILAIPSFFILSTETRD